MRLGNNNVFEKKFDGFIVPWDVNFYEGLVLRFWGKTLIGNGTLNLIVDNL